MLSNALALSLITTGGAYVVYQKLPQRVKNFLEKYSLVTDFVAFVSTYVVLGGTLTALVAAGLCSLMISGMLHVANNKEDYLYLYDAHQWLKQYTGKAKDALNEYGKIYREKNKVAISE